MNKFYSFPADANGDEQGMTTDARLDGRAFQTPLVSRLFRILVRRRWAAAGIMAAAIVLGLVVTLLTTPLYTATARIEISREGDRVTEIQSVERETSSADLEFYQTQYGLLRSTSLAEDIARELRLADDMAFRELYGIDEAIPAGLIGNAAKEQRIRAIGEVLLEHVAITPVRLSRLVDISFTSPDPGLSVKIANAWGQRFIQGNLSRRFQATSYARKFLEDRLEQLRQRLEESERKLVAYAAQQNIINLPGTIDRQTGQTVGERSLVADELARLSDELATATANRIEAQSQIARANRAGPNTSTVQNIAIGELRQRRAELTADYAKLMAQFEPSYPPAQAIASQIESLNLGVAREEARVDASLRTSFDSSRARETALRSRVDQLKAGLTDLRGRTIQYNIFQRDVDTNRELYDGLLQRYKEIGIAGGVGTNNISIVDPAQVPDRPSEPSLMINLILAILIGLLLVGGMIWLLEHVDEGVTDPSDVARLLNLPLLGTVPKSSEDSPLTELANPRSPMLESYLAIQTNLELATAHGAPRSLSITSTRPQEGKSTTSYAIAHSLARANRKVVLVDCDMRAPMIHRQFGLSNANGVSNFLAGNDDLSASLHPSPQPGLSIMTSGPQPPNAAELLIGPKLSDLVAKLLEQFDHVVIDSPPVMGLADAPLIAGAVEGTVYTIEAQVVRTNLVRMALGRLHDAKVNVLGAVLTKFDAKASSYGYGFDYGYGYTRSEHTE